MNLEQTIDLNQILRDRLKVSKDAIAQFCQKWKIVEFALFGSVLRDDFRAEGDDPSDVDVLVVFDQNSGWSLFDLIEMQRTLERQFGRKVDVTQKKGLENPFSRSEILKTHRVIYPFEKASLIEIVSADKMTQDNARNNAALLDMVIAIQRIQRFISETTFEAYLENELLQSAVERNLEIIGEAARRRLTEAFRASHPEVDWSGAIGLRNVVAHQYDRIDQAEIWRIITTVLPPLLEQLTVLLPPLPEE